MGSDQEVTVENLYRLVEHQVSVLDKLSSGPVTEEEWHQVIKDIFLAGGGLLSPQVWRSHTPHERVQATHRPGLREEALPDADRGVSQPS
jgi:hypothetical protein